MKRVIIAAAALLAGCVSGSTTPVELPAELTVRVQLGDAAKTREVSTGNMAGGSEKSFIINGYVCFTNSNDVVTAVYRIGSGSTQGDEIHYNDINSSSVVLEHVSGTSTAAWVFGNMGSIPEKPKVGENVRQTMLEAPLLLARDMDNQYWIPQMGREDLNITPDNSTASVTVQMFTQVAYLKVMSVSFSGMTGKFEGIFVNNYVNSLSYLGAYGSVVRSSDAAQYVKGSKTFPEECDTKLYDVIPGSDNTKTGHEFTDGEKVTPPRSVKPNPYWAYILLTMEDTAPQIVIKLTGITANGVALSGDRFVTVELKDKATGVPLKRLEAGKIYTIEDDALVIKPEHLNPTPGVGKLAVTVTVKRVEWQNADPIVPDM